jgi:hypothetical protein
MRVSLVLFDPATLAVLSEINSLHCVSIPIPLCCLVYCDIRLEVSELTRKVLLGLVP